MNTNMGATEENSNSTSNSISKFNLYLFILLVEVGEVNKNVCNSYAIHALCHVRSWLTSNSHALVTKPNILSLLHNIFVKNTKCDLYCIQFEKWFSCICCILCVLV